MTETTGRTTLTIRSIPDAIAAVPYLLGFHPAESLVAIGFGGPHNTCAVRADLPHLGAPLEGTAGHLTAMLGSGGFPNALLLGYGPRERVDGIVAAVRTATAPAGIGIVDAARVADGRWWSLTCGPECCPPEGRPFDISASAVAAQAVLDGQVALADRAELASLVSPHTGAIRASMRQATAAAERRMRDRGREVHRARTRMRDEALGLLADLRRARRSPTHDEIAWLGVLLTDLRIRDEAFVRVDVDDPFRDIAFWRDVLRHVEEPYASAPACLLARAAYAAGDGGLANVALERADTDYSMATLLSAVIAAGIPPSDPHLRMTPDELSALYETDETDETDGADDEDDGR